MSRPPSPITTASSASQSYLARLASQITIGSDGPITVVDGGLRKKYGRQSRVGGGEHIVLRGDGVLGPAVGHGLVEQRLRCAEYGRLQAGCGSRRLDLIQDRMQGPDRPRRGRPLP